MIDVNLRHPERFSSFPALFLTRSESLPVNLPKAASAEVQERTRIYGYR